MDEVQENRPASYEGGEEPNLSDYKKIVLEKERFQKILENKVKELDRSNKELEEFAYIASHDLQEPLRKITSFSERLKEKLPANLEPDVQLYLNRMLAATTNMRTLIDNLLEFSRTSRNNEPFRKVNLNDILSEVKSELELKIEENKAVIEVTTPLPSLDAIPMQMRQLFTNLLSNAIKFKKEGETPYIQLIGQLLSDKEKEEYHLSSQPYYKITIKDNGIGFEQEYAEKIFQIFQRLHGKAEFPGSGIGLAICKKIADNHKGEIFAVSEVGKGASFVIILPETQNEIHEGER